MTEMKKLLARKDEQIERLTNLLFDALQQVRDSQAEAHYSRIWSKPGGNL